MAASGGYRCCRCCCGFDHPSFVLTILAYHFGRTMPEFKLQLPAAAAGGTDVEATLCGYVVPSFEGYLWFGDFSPTRFYRLVYRRRGKNGSGGTLPLPPAVSALRPHSELEERRLMATEEGRQRYGLRYN